MKEIFESILSRPIYLDKIRPFMGKPLVKVFTGQRRVGKSFLLFQLHAEITEKQPDANIIYINKEDFSFDFIRNYADLIAYVEQKMTTTGAQYLMVDEIQDIEDFEKAIRHIALNPSIDIYITGSNAKLLGGELATFLGGRYIECKVYTLSFTEFLEFANLNPDEDSLQRYLDWGGLPFLRNLQPKQDIVMEYLRAITNSILLKDVVQRHNIRNSAFLENLVQFLASNTGNIISAKSISDYLKSQRVSLSPQIVLNYLDFLQSGMLIFKARRKDLTGKKVFEIHEKYYFEDWGMMNSIIGYNNRNIGKTLENVVYIQLKILGFEVYVGSLNSLEIDFVAEKNGLTFYFQVCYLMPDTNVVNREFGSLEAIQDNYPKYVISLDKQAPANRNGIRHLHLLDFLTKKDWE
jgi:predicted AAA+ superfamily ATPase